MTSPSLKKYFSALSLAANRLSHCYSLARNVAQLHETFQSSYVHRLSVFDSFTITAKDFDELGPFQNMIFVVLTTAWKNHYRKRGTTIYRRKYVNGVYVHFYEYFKTISEFVYGFTSDVLIGEHWSLFTQKGEYIKKVIDHLENGSHTFLPVLETDRHRFAFANGVYDIVTEEFKPHDQVSNGIAAVNYFEQVVEWDEIAPFLNTPFFAGGVAPRYEANIPLHSHDWMNMPGEEALTKVITTQWREERGASEDTPIECQVEYADLVHRFFWVMVGRLLYNLGELDNFQRQGQVYGESGTGKSLILLVIMAIYPADFVEILSSAMESKFATANLERMLLYLFDEAEEELGLFESDFLTAISGGWLVRREKFKTHGKFRCVIPGMLTANRFVNFKHFRSAVARRMFPFWMKHKIPADRKDTQLEFRALQQLPLIIIKANTAYRRLMSYMREHEIGDIEVIWPKFFTRIIEQFMYAKMPMMHWYFTSSNLRFDPLKVCPLNVLRRDFIQWCKHNAITGRDAEWSESTIEQILPQKHTAFLKRKLVNGVWKTVRSAHCPDVKIRREYRGRDVEEYFVTGVDVVYIPRASDDEKKRHGEDDPYDYHQEQEIVYHHGDPQVPRLPDIDIEDEEAWLSQSEVEIPNQSFDAMRSAYNQFKQSYGNGTSSSIFVPERNRHFVKFKLIPNMKAYIVCAEEHHLVRMNAEQRAELVSMIAKLSECVGE